MPFCQSVPEMDGVNETKKLIKQKKAKILKWQANPPRVVAIESGCRSVPNEVDKNRINNIKKIKAEESEKLKLASKLATIWGIESGAARELAVRKLSEVL
jgi:hypothetical protein